MMVTRFVCVKMNRRNEVIDIACLHACVEQKYRLPEVHTETTSALQRSENLTVEE